MPVALTLGTLPHHRGLSVVGAAGDFAIMLPFMQVKTVIGDGFVAIVMPAVHNVSNSYVVFGSNKTASSLRVLGELCKREGRLLTDVLSFDFTGRSVASAGDVDGDGYDDLIIGVPYAARVYVLFGKREGFVNMTEGFTVFGAGASDLTGWSVSGAGYVNNDTFADIIIGAPQAGEQSTGAAYVLYGRPNMFFDVFVANMTADQGFTMTGDVVGDCLGLSVSGAGDVNSDGQDDLIVGALVASKFNAGAAYIVMGGNVSSEVVRASDSAALVLFGDSFSYAGYSVSGAGDVNRDGHYDVIVGSIARRGERAVESAYVVFGRQKAISQWRSPVRLSSLTAENGTVYSGGGVAVRGMGDINHDGFDDVFVGSEYGFATAGGYVLQTPSVLPNVTESPSVAPSQAPTVTRTRSPSASPSTRLPSIKPSVAPSRVPSLRPTTPTVDPTKAPSGPTMLPTLLPTQPSSTPSVAPTAPSRAPSRQPTSCPSGSPTMVPKPTRLPTCAPSLVPSTGPTSVAPSQAPSLTPSMAPVVTRPPLARPSAMPTGFYTPGPTARPGVTYIEVNITMPGTYTRYPAQTKYIVNSTQVVEIVGAAILPILFVVLPNRDSRLVIHNFSVHSDIIDLRAFWTLHSLADCNTSSSSSSLASVSPTTARRLLHSGSSEANQSVVFHLERSQTIVLTHVSFAQLNASNFIFATENLTATAEVKEEDEGTPFWQIIQISVCSAIGAAVVVKAALVLYNEFDASKVPTMTPVEYHEIKATNPTFVEIVHGKNSVKSGSKSSSGDSSSSIQESKSDGSSDDSGEEGDADRENHLGRKNSSIRRMFAANDRERFYSEDSGIVINSSSGGSGKRRMSSFLFASSSRRGSDQQQQQPQRRRASSQAMSEDEFTISYGSHRDEDGDEEDDEQSGEYSSIHSSFIDEQVDGVGSDSRDSLEQLGGLPNHYNQAEGMHSNNDSSASLCTQHSNCDDDDELELSQQLHDSFGTGGRQRADTLEELGLLPAAVCARSRFYSTVSTEDGEDDGEEEEDREDNGGEYEHADFSDFALALQSGKVVLDLDTYREQLMLLSNNFSQSIHAIPEEGE